MSKKNIRGCIVLSVILVVISVIAFAIPFSKTPTFWLAYIFSVIAILFQVYVYKISFADAEDVKSKFYGFPIARVGIIYLIVQLLLSLVEMILAAIVPTWVAIVINILPIAFAIVGCIAAETLRDEIVEQDNKLKKNLNNMRNLQSMSASLVGMCSNDEMKEMVQKLADDFKYSDPVSSEQTTEIENDLNIQLKELQKALIDGDYESAKTFCGKLLSDLSERNRICALNK